MSGNLEIEELVTRLGTLIDASGHDPEVFQAVGSLFQRCYHKSGVEGQCHWLGWRMYKTPQDLFLFQEIIERTRPTLILESGTWRGGSALFYASVLDGLGAGSIISVDPKAISTPEHPRIRYVRGSSLDAETLTEVYACSIGQRVMVILDSLHQAEHVYAEMSAYAALVSPGCYMIVEDTSLNGNPIEPDHGPGPMEAVERAINDLDFPLRRDEEVYKKYGFTYHPGGFLLRPRCDEGVV